MGETGVQMTLDIKGWLKVKVKVKVKEGSCVEREWRERGGQGRCRKEWEQWERGSRKTDQLLADTAAGKSSLAELHLRVYQAVGWLHCFIRSVVAWPRVLEGKQTEFHVQLALTVVCKNLLLC